MVVHVSTIRGLDEALAELERAIDSITDAETKKQLQKKYQRLSEARRTMSGSPCPPPMTGKILFLVGLAALLLVMLFHYYHRRS